MSTDDVENMYKESLENRNKSDFRVVIQIYSYHNNTEKRSFPGLLI